MLSNADFGRFRKTWNFRFYDFQQNHAIDCVQRWYVVSWYLYFTLQLFLRWVSSESILDKLTHPQIVEFCGKCGLEMHALIKCFFCTLHYRKTSWKELDFLINKIGAKTLKNRLYCTMTPIFANFANMRNLWFFYFIENNAIMCVQRLYVVPRYLGFTDQLNLRTVPSETDTV